MIRRIAAAGSVGLVQGGFGGLVGLGGGVIAVPLLRASGYSQHEAAATTLPAVIFAGLTGGAAFLLAGEKVEENTFEGAEKKVKLLPVAATSIGGAMSAPIAARIALKTKGSKLARLMGGFMLLSAPMVLYKEKLFGKASILDNAHPVIASGAFLGVGIIAGIATGLFGVGGGVVKVPLLSMLMDHQAALGTSLLTMLPPSLLALWSFRAVIVWPAVPLMVMGASVGGWIAANFTINLTEKQQRSLFALIVTPLGLLSLRG